MFAAKQAVAPCRTMCWTIGCLTLALLRAPALAQCNPDELQELIPPDLSIRFGIGVAVEGDTLAIGASRYDAPLGDEDIGAVYLYARAGGVWTFDSILLAGDAEADDAFGATVDIDGDTMIVAAPDAALNDNGAIYVYVRSGNAWVQQAKITSTEGSGYLGGSVAVDGDTLIAGAYVDDAAHIYVRNNGVWALQATLTGTSGDQFGWSVAVDGDSALVGAPGYDNGHGSASVYVRVAGVWSKQAQFTGVQDGFGTFGSSVAIDADTAVVGKYNGAHSGELAVGSAYVFSRSGETWSEGTQLVPPDPVPEDWFGYSLALDGDSLLIGSPSWYDGGLVGSAHVYLRANSIWSHAATLVPASSDEYEQYGSIIALDGTTAMVASPGEDSVVVFELNCESQLDTDGDKIPDLSDNCPFASNPDQADLDGDGIGDVCDDDIDGDGVLNDADVCDNGPVGAPVNEEGRPVGDNDADCDLDLTDHAAFVACFNGPNTPPGGLGCRDAFNTDGDIDIDLVDWANFQRWFTGQ